MAAWRFFNRQVNGEDYIRTEWSWALRDDNGVFAEATVGFFTLAACVDDARRRGFTHAEEVEYDFADVRCNGLQF